MPRASRPNAAAWTRSWCGGGGSFARVGVRARGRCPILTRALPSLALRPPWTKPPDSSTSPYNSETQGRINEARALRGEASCPGRAQRRVRAGSLSGATCPTVPCCHDRHAFCIKRKIKFKVILLLEKTRQKEKNRVLRTSAYERSPSVIQKGTALL